MWVRGPATTVLGKPLQRLTTPPRRVAVTVARSTPPYQETCTLLGLSPDGPQQPKTHRIFAADLAKLDLPGPLCLAKSRVAAEDAADLDIVFLEGGPGDASLTRYLGGTVLADVRDAHTVDWARCQLRKALGTNVRATPSSTPSLQRSSDTDCSTSSSPSGCTSGSSEARFTWPAN